jgi:hypothetical protein
MRWTARRKAEVIKSIEKRLVTIEEAKARFELSDEELSIWMHDYITYGVAGLRVTRHPRYWKEARAVPAQLIFSAGTLPDTS